MAKRRVVWTKESRLQLKEILEYFRVRNKSGNYSSKLYSKFKRELRIAAEEPEIGVKTDLDNIRGLIIGNYILFYEIQLFKIQVFEVWDNRQNPGKLKFRR